MDRAYRIIVRFLTWLLALQAVGHLVLTVLFYAGVNEQGYGFFLDWHWPAPLITVLDIAGAAALRWTLGDEASNHPRWTVAATALVATYLAGRMAWTGVIPILALIATVGSIRAALRQPTRDPAS